MDAGASVACSNQAGAPPELGHAVQPGSCAFLRGHPQLLAGCLSAVSRTPAQGQLLQQLLDAFLDPHTLLRHSPGSVKLCQVGTWAVQAATLSMSLVCALPQPPIKACASGWRLSALLLPRHRL